MKSEYHLFHLLSAVIVFLIVLSRSHALTLRGSATCRRWCKSEDFYFCCGGPGTTVHPGKCPPRDKECPRFAIRNLPGCTHDGDCIMGQKCCFQPCENGGSPTCQLAQT